MGQLRYQKIPAPKRLYPTQELRKQRLAEREADEANRAAIIINVNHKMQYSRIETPNKLSLAQQIKECLQLVENYEQQWQKLEAFPGDKTPYRLALKYARNRLDELLKLQGKEPQQE